MLPDVINGQAHCFYVRYVSQCDNSAHFVYKNNKINK